MRFNAQVLHKQSRMCRVQPTLTNTHSHTHTPNIIVEMKLTEIKGAHETQWSIPRRGRTSTGVWVWAGAAEILKAPKIILNIHQCSTFMMWEQKPATQCARRLVQKTDRTGQASERVNKTKVIRKVLWTVRESISITNIACSDSSGARRDENGVLGMPATDDDRLGPAQTAEGVRGFVWYFCVGFSAVLVWRR